MLSFEEWLEALAARHMKALRLTDVRRGVQALSSIYVERRKKIDEALSSAGKRAAFALYYGSLHYLAVREIVLRLDAQRDPPPPAILDLGCGTGAAGVAWAGVTESRPRLFGIDVHPWAIEEARWTYGTLGVDGTVRRASLDRVPLPGRAAVVAAYAVNEVDAATRASLLRRLLGAAEAGTRVLVVEPVARPRWWDDWSEAFRAQGGRDDTWRFPIDRPEPLRTLDEASGLDHREMAARSLYLKGGNL